MSDIETKEGFYYINRSGQEIGPLIFNPAATNYNHMWFIPGHGEFRNKTLTARYFAHLEEPKHHLDLLGPTAEAYVTLTYTELVAIIETVHDIARDENDNFFIDEVLEKLKWRKSDT